MEKETLQEKFTAFKEQVEELRKKLQETGEAFLVENLKAIFAKYPKLQKIQWTAYTPYFNDGETCEYRSNHRWADIEGEGLSYDNPEFKIIEKEVREFLSQFDHELMKSLFGDHIQITVTKEGISVEEYEHE